MKNILFFLILILSFDGFSQKKKSECGTKPKEPFFIHQDKNKKIDGTATPYCIRTYITIFADNDGTNASATQTDVMNKFEWMVNHFRPHNICFMLINVRQINDTDLNTMVLNDTDASIDETEELDPFKIDKCLNIFIHSGLISDGESINGSAYDIPNEFLSVAAEAIASTDNMSTMAHEAGHCFGLYHTHEDWGGAKRENVARTGDCKNCENKGDLLCDTPASDDSTTNSLCQYIGGGTDDCGITYTPDVNNIMAYGNHRSCRNSFTAEQADRMRSFVNNISFADVVVNHTVNSPLIPLDNINLSSGETIETARDELYISRFAGNEYNVTGTAKVFLQSKKVTLGKGTHFNPSTNGRISVKSNTYCN